MKRILKQYWFAAVFLSLLLSGCAASATAVPTQVEGRKVVQEDGFSQASSETEPLPAEAAATAEAETGAAEGAPDNTQEDSSLQAPDTGNEVVEQPEADASPTPDTRKEPKYWPEWPLIPDVSARARAIYARGQELGNDPHSFTTIGDCQSEPSVFLGVYDSDHYMVGEDYEYLEETIRQFQGSFTRDAVTVKDGLSVASALSAAWADPERCEKGETPLACEIRLHRPVIAFINLGTNWRGGDDVTHEAYMRQVVDVLIENGVVPVISSKGDNLEGDHRLNRSMARVAYDYDLPLWNFWRSIRDLPGKGIDDTRPGGYLTTEAWGRRSFTGLQALDAVWRGLTE